MSFCFKVLRHMRSSPWYFLGLGFLRRSTSRLHAVVCAGGVRPAFARDV